MTNSVGGRGNGAFVAHAIGFGTGASCQNHVRIASESREKSIWSATPDAVERTLAGVIKNAQSFLVGAEHCIDMEFEKHTARRIAFELTNAARSHRHGVEGSDIDPFLSGVPQLNAWG
jgi:hypothetical protein